MSLSQKVEHEYGLRWEASGKPTLEAAPEGATSLSISHDGEVCICTLGDASQGCDIEAVSRRDYESWRGLLGHDFSDLLNELSRSESLDLAGTRIWAAKEATIKATGKPCTVLLERAREDDAVLFSGRTEEGEVSVLTYPAELTTGPTRMLAVVVEEAGETSESATPGSDSREIRDSGITRISAENQGPSGAQPARVYRPKAIEELPEQLRYLYADGKLNPFEVDVAFGPFGQPVYVWRFPLTFRDASDMGRGIYFSRYLGWMGQIRELSVAGILPQLRDLYMSGKWGTVTNSWETHQFDDANQDDIIEGRLYCTRLYGRFDAAFDLVCEWTATDRQNRERPLAVTTMTASWVEVLGHAEVALAPMPDFFNHYMNLMVTPLGPPSKSLLDPNMKAPLEQLWGRRLHEHARTAAGWPTVRTSSFQTTLDHGNLVGNIYYSNYPAWAGQTRDLFFFSHAPQLYRDGDYRGEFLCRRMSVNHLREAMPFDRIRVEMGARAVYECGARLTFQFFRESDDGSKVKLAAAEQDVVFGKREGTELQPLPIPAAVREALLAGGERGLSA